VSSPAPRVRDAWIIVRAAASACFYQGDFLLDIETLGLIIAGARSNTKPRLTRVWQAEGFICGGGSGQGTGFIDEMVEGSHGEIRGRAAELCQTSLQVQAALWAL
jgi:hypothetical protein